MVARYLQKLSHLTPSDRRDNFCKYRATMKFLAPFLKEMDFRLGNTTDVIHFDLLLFCPIYYSVSTRKRKSIGFGYSTKIIK